MTTSNEIVKVEAQRTMPLAVMQPTFAELERMAEMVAKGGLFAACGTKEGVFTLMLLAQAEGIHPIKAMQQYDIIKGRPSMKSAAMLARYQESGGTHRWLKRTDAEVVLELTNPNGYAQTFTWNDKDSERAGLASSENHKKYPLSMKSARAISQGVRAMMPGIGCGLYTPEEVDDFIDRPGRKPEEVIITDGTMTTLPPAPAPDVDQRPEWEKSQDAVIIALQERGYTRHGAHVYLSGILQSVGKHGDELPPSWWQSMLNGIAAGRADKKPAAPPMAITPETTTPLTPEPKPATPSNKDFWEEFKSSWLSLAASKGINLTVAAEGLKKAVQNVGMRGSESQIPSVTTTLWYSALEHDAFDMETGRVNQVQMALVPEMAAAGA